MLLHLTRLIRFRFADTARTFGQWVMFLRPWTMICFPLKEKEETFEFRHMKGRKPHICWRILEYCAVRYGESITSIERDTKYHHERKKKQDNFILKINSWSLDDNYTVRNWRLNHKGGARRMEWWASKIRDHNKVCNAVFSRSGSNPSRGPVIGMSASSLLLVLLLSVLVQGVQKNGDGLFLWIDRDQVKMFSGKLYKVLIKIPPL